MFINIYIRIKVPQLQKEYCILVIIGLTLELIEFSIYLYFSKCFHVDQVFSKSDSYRGWDNKNNCARGAQKLKLCISKLKKKMFLYMLSWALNCLSLA